MARSSLPKVVLVIAMVLGGLTTTSLAGAALCGGPKIKGICFVPGVSAIPPPRRGARGGDRASVVAAEHGEEGLDHRMAEMVGSMTLTTRETSITVETWRHAESSSSPTRECSRSMWRAHSRSSREQGVPQLRVGATAPT